MKYHNFINYLFSTKVLVFFAALLSIGAILYSYLNNLVLSYGDSESHINIAKRVVDSITPGLAQLGGIWLPLPHLLMVPFVKFDFLWRTGLAGSIVGGICFIVASLYIYKLTYLITRNKLASFISFLVFALNPNILYLQSTPLTEMPLITFIVLSIFYLAKFLKTESITLLMLAAIFGLCATLSRYDGWALVVMEALILFMRYIPHQAERSKLQSLIQLFSFPAFAGIIFWLFWDGLILGNPLYFTSSPYSAKSQQQNWLDHHELPAYHNIMISLAYYLFDSLSIIGIVTFVIALIGLLYYLFKVRKAYAYFIVLLLITPFLFNVLTLFLGESVIFLPQITPANFEWHLFNARYGALMVPAAAFFIGYLFFKLKKWGRFITLGLLGLQLVLFISGISPVLTVADGVSGLSASKHPDAELWLAKNYDSGLVLLDDYARSVSVIGSKVPMQDIIYVGNKPYWDNALKNPQDVVTWIVIQKNDTLWNNFIVNSINQANLYKYYNKVYTSPTILIFKRMQ